jgi:hypothetical protein
MTFTLDSRKFNPRKQVGADALRAGFDNPPLKTVVINP